MINIDPTEDRMTRTRRILDEEGRARENVNGFTSIVLGWAFVVILWAVWALAGPVAECSQRCEAIGSGELRGMFDHTCECIPTVPAP